MTGKREKLNWIALLGAPVIEAVSIRYRSPSPTTGPESPQPLWAILRSNQYFQAGTIQFDAHLGGPDSKCQVILNHGTENQLFVGLNISPAAYGIILYRNSKWELPSSGRASSGDAPAPQKKWLKIRITVAGSNVSLFVEGVEVATTQAVIQKAQLGLALAGSAETQVRNFIIREHNPKAFIVMQFTDDFNALFQEVIKPTCEKFGYDCVRADNIYNNGQIIEDIARSIREAAVVIADITPNNPNVFYEVGYSHGINKPTILLSNKTRDNLPFDVSGFRTLFYENSIGGKSLIEERLTHHLENIGR